MMPLLPLIVSWIGGVALLLLDGRRRAVMLSGAALLALVLGLDLLALLRLRQAGVGPWQVVTGGWPAGIGIRLHVDALGLFFASVCAAVLLAVTVHEALRPVRGRLFPALVLLLCAGLHGAFFTGDLFSLYVFFELSMVASFALSAYGYGRAEVRAAFAYVVVNLFGTVLFLVAVANLYHSTGTLDLARLAQAVANEDVAAGLPATLLLVAFLLKLGLFPFHGWVPLLYSHVQPAVAAALGGALVNLGAYALLRLGALVFEGVREQAAPLLLLLGGTAAVYGALVGAWRTRAAELAAYAAIAHAGYLVVALGIGGPYGAAAMLLLVLAGSLDKTMMFLSLEGSLRSRGSAALVAGLSFAGLPLTLGFLAKVALFRAAWAAPAAPWLLSALVVSALLAALLAARFHLLVRALPEGRDARGFVAFALALVSVTLGLVPDIFAAAAWWIGRGLGLAET